MEEITHRVGFLDKDYSRNCGEPLTSNEYGQFLLIILER
jgi:hypothetical protein